ncbi:TIGR03986 family type III CRISPR-associated RAMP protein [Calothrix sp. NIES-3974]|uniref:TIGR03986 family type III CRISPR-associated RAMP protein n=1 Tax=Calothrix sp. NIES-3974 TaxID=2005462 RepID=UPI000B5E2BA1|nr:TIGR03986 family CRISPR-associated RAMP protein [Calothrix sp. NIES-3974]BAZ06392.1 hypothetical protein NIES3974_30530 [Calothrix sp. NIES-3974]
MLPRPLKNVPENRKAVAPYNFVELPNQIVEVKPDSLPQQNIYYSQSENRYTGRINCTLTTESPLYIRCGLTTEEFACGAESKDLADFFYTGIANKARKPVIPGSSLRGMIRSLVEIISFSKLDKVSDADKFFFRAVAADKDDPLKNIYTNYLKKENLKAGYLVKKDDGWYIRPATKIEDKYFIYIKEKHVEGKIDGFICMKSLDYVPQYRQNISFGDFYTQNGRCCAKKISNDCTEFEYMGVLVTSGNMLESTNLDEQERERKLKSKGGRKYHYLVGIPDSKAELIKINDDAITAYCRALTNFQKAKSPYDNNPFEQDSGVLKNGRVIFYSQIKSEEIILFGHCPNFRIPYSPLQDGKAASAVDFIPNHIGKSDKIDLADAIFGFVREKDKNHPNSTHENNGTKLSALAGRVFIENAICEKTVNDDIWLTGNLEQTITPKILSNPKPTTFQHYLVQSNDDKAQLKHYASKPVEDTVIRGHKLYWHKPNAKKEDIEENDTTKIKKSSSQYTKIKPIKAGVKFTFDIHFENLSNIELGALLWILKIAANPKYCLSLGMGKPLGMGAVKIEYQLLLNNRHERYSQLFNSNQWLTGEENQSNTDSKSQACIDAFEKFIVDNIHPDDHPEGYNATKLDKIPRIQMLLLMLRCDNPPSADNTRYMTIEPTNEYKERPILPTPFQVMNKLEEDKRKFPPPTESPEKPKLKKNNSRKKNHQNNRSKPGNGNNSNFATQRPPKPPKK